MNEKVRIILLLLGSFTALSVVLGNGVATGSTHVNGNVISKEVSSSKISVPDNCIILSSGELECRDSLTQNISISISN